MSAEANWLMRSCACTGCGIAWLASVIIGEPPPLYVVIGAFAAGFFCLVMGARAAIAKAEGKTE